MRLLSAIACSCFILIGCSSSNNPESTVNDANEDTVRPTGNELGASDSPGGEQQQSTDTTINAQNYLQILKDSVRVMNLIDIDSYRDDAYDLKIEIDEAREAIQEGKPGIFSIDLLSQETLPQNDEDTPVNRQQYACSQGGMLKVDAKDFGLAPVTSTNYTFNVCNYEGAVRNGSYDYSSARRSNRIDTFNTLEKTEADLSVSLTGKREFVYIWTGNKAELYWHDVSFKSDVINMAVNGLNWHRYGVDSVTPGAEVFEVTDLEGNTQRIFEVQYQTNLSADFQMATDATQQTPISISASLMFDQNYMVWATDYLGQSHPIPSYPVSDLGAPLVFEWPERSVTLDNLPQLKQAQWQTGQVTLSAPDGSKITLRPSTNDSSKAVIELNGSSEQVLLDWSDGIQIDCAEVIPGCGDNAGGSY